MSTSAKTIDIEVLRYLPEQAEHPFRQTFVVPCTDDMSVLQGLQHIKDEI
ncbi:MAG: fumarate reductase iron-sulfur subunit, partial [Betaproteobacteria bacterium]|nr:fumarate reductase iron-sulfur subunit [Betaproteobacteria bacterium]